MQVYYASFTIDRYSTSEVDEIALIFLIRFSRDFTQKDFFFGAIESRESGPELSHTMTWQ